ncbi:ABC-F family ATP-binding cassette domain-containing protein [Olivibacter sitiensis]|uniref:ABC-F family ATP-binding cassette domain-containing protein n=1 Tax=Olivibacter sitiensis TaxID=376470 RepID=UPI00040A6DCA|nr:ABC-F family ATP-binding cassette domain-containing protein [Olivibacter sitiensis]
MSILSTENLGHSFNDRWLFKNLFFGIQRGERIALVGINGTGKSTLLKILAGKFLPTEGIVVQERDLKVGYLEQDPVFDADSNIEDFIYSIDNEQQQLIRSYEKLLTEEHPDEDLLQDLIEKISNNDAWEYEDQIKTILSRLGIFDLNQKIGSLSGGQKKRLSLAKLLIDDPDIYILDEPTNHLDIETIEWLEKLLTTGQKTVLLVTHDRYFLDNVCNGIKELDKGKLFNYSGNYSYYLEKKAEREGADALALEKNKNLLRKELEWMRRQPQARGTKSKARIDAFYDLEDKTKNTGSKEQVELSMKVSRQGNKILEIDHVSKSFGNKPIIEDFSYVFKKGDRIGLAGRNGTGKSTFLNLITQEIPPDEGTITVGETTVYGYYKQGGLEINPNDRVIDIVKNVAEYIQMAGGETITASQLLTHFLFPPEKQYGLVHKLSGGERKRLQLMRILMKNPNFLILDEPTNDLDIDTLNVLETFLDKFNGVLLLVSHDRYLLDKLTEQLFIMEGNGSIRIYNGNYADYKNEEQERAKEAKIGAKGKVEVKQTPIENKKKISFKEKQELDNLPIEIADLENNIKETEGNIIEHTDPDKIIELALKIEELKSKLDIKTERWLELEELSNS